MLFPARRLRNDFDDFARHLIYQKNLIFHLRIPVVGKLRDLLSQLRRKAIGLDGVRQFGTIFRRKIFGRFGLWELELNLRVLAQQCLSNPLALRVIQLQVQSGNTAARRKLLHVSILTSIKFKVIAHELLFTSCLRNRPVTSEPQIPAATS